MYYFAYASNLNHKQMKERCPDSKPEFTATLPNYKLVFVGWSRQYHGGIASIKPLRGEKVLGAVYEISDRDLRRLDSYEGYPRDYNRFNVTVFSEDGEQVPAITYIKAGRAEETPPSPEYLAIIQQGYRDWEIV
ncbi:MAG: gamma-glutamylcyclotransferase family protein [Dehalococcoidales bacterium]|nr:gamma-glutamylcyclotransferase family protein [Dehalococcoidales bacterium]